MFAWLVVSGTACAPRVDDGKDWTHSDVDVLDHAVLSPRHLAAELVSAELALGNPVFVRVGAEHVWVLDRAGDPFFHLISAADGRLVRSVGRRGQGPGDVTSAHSITTRPGDGDAVWAFDDALQRLTRMAPRLDDQDHLRTLGVGGAGTVGTVIWLDRDRLVADLVSDSPRLGFIEESGVLRDRVPRRVLGADSVPYSARLRASRIISLCARPDGRGFFVAHLYAGQIDAYDERGRLVHAVDVPFPSDPVFEATPAGEVVFRWRRSWYGSCAVSGDRLYALFSGALRPAPGLQVRPGCRGFVHVFDLHGRFREAYVLDHPVDGIDVDPSGQWLYGACGVSATVVRFRLPRDARSQHPVPAGTRDS